MSAIAQATAHAVKLFGSADSLSTIASGQTGAYTDPSHATLGTIAQHPSGLSEFWHAGGDILHAIGTGYMAADHAVSHYGMDALNSLAAPLREVQHQYRYIRAV